MQRIVKKTNETLSFEYINWKGEKGVRNVKPIKIWYGKTKFHKSKQWLLKAVDVDKNAERDFALKDVIKFF